MTLYRLLVRTAWQRLKRDRSFSLASVLSLAAAGAMFALAGAWLWTQLAVQPPYRSLDDLWFVQVTRFDAGQDEYGPEMQASVAAMRRLVERQTLFDDLLAARPIGAVLTAPNAGGDAETRVGRLAYSPNFWQVLGVTFAAGTAPRADHSEIAVSHDFALRHFDSAQAAVGQMLELHRETLTIRAVLSSGFVAPAQLGPQRYPHGRMDLYQPSARLLEFDAADDADRGEPWLLVGRSAEAQTVIEQRIALQFEQIAAEMGRWNLGVSVRPLRTHMLGDAPAMGFLLMTAAAVLAASTIFGNCLLAAGRFSSRAGNTHALRACGASPVGEWAFERSEALLLTGLAGLGSIVLIGTIVSLFELAELTRAIADPAFILRGSIAILIYIGVLAGSLLLVAIAVSPMDNRWISRIQMFIGLSQEGLHGPVLRFFQVSQVLIALAAITVLLVLLDSARGALSAASGLDYSDIVQWEMEYPAGTQADMMRDDLERMRQATLATPGVEAATISLASALDLLSDYPIRYAGPRFTGTETVTNVNDDGSYIVQSNDDGGFQRDSLLRYNLFLAPVEPQFFSMLGYRALQGRSFDDSDQDVAVMTPAASRLLFSEYRNVVDENVPAPPRLSGRGGALDLWHSGVRVIGEVEDRRVHMAIAALEPLVQSPVVFVPYRGPTATRSSSSARGYILIQLAPGHLPSALLMDEHAGNSLIPGLRATATVLEAEKNRRLRQHLLGSLGTLAIGLLVIMSAALGAWGSSRLAAFGRRQEIAVRLAMGADENRLVREILKTELLWPLLLALAWILTVAFVGAIARSTGFSSPAPIGDAFLAVAIVISTVGFGSISGIREPVLQPPMEVLRAE